MINIVDITFEFEFGLINSRFMRVEIEYDQKMLTATPNSSKVTVKDIILPAQVKIKFLGKNLSTDTVVDKSGNILQDMYVKLAKINIDNLKVPDWAIQKKFSFTTEDGILLNTSYIGFNGEMIIDIPEFTVFSFYRRLTTDFS